MIAFLMGDFNLKKCRFKWIFYVYCVKILIDIPYTTNVEKDNKPA